VPLRTILVSAVLVPVSSAVSRAQEEDVFGPEGSVALEEMVVTAPRDGGPRVKVVLGEELVAGGQSTTAEAHLAGMAGIDLNRRSTSGNENSRLAIRGFDESRSQILLNGRSLHGAGVYGGYYVDWASLSLEDIASIAVVRGVAPAKYGNTLGGVVNIVTGRPGEEIRTVFDSAFGSLDTWDLQAAHSGCVGSCLYGFAAGHHETDGYLRNGFLDRETFSARTTVHLPRDFSLTVSGRFTSNECGMTAYNMPGAYDYDPGSPDSLGAELGGPGVAWLDDATGPKYWGEGSYWEDQRLQVDLGVHRKTEYAEFSFQTYVSDQDRTERFYANDNPGLLVLKRDAEPEDNNFGWKAEWRNVLENRGGHTLEYGAEGQYLGWGGVHVLFYDPTYFSATKPPSDMPAKDSVTRLHGAYVQDALGLLEGLELEFGIRVDDYLADGPEANAPYIHDTTASPRIACDWKAWEGGRLTARYGRAYRFPTNPEYYWWYNGYDPATGGVDRCDLTSEKANQFELEAAHTTSAGVSVVLRGYHYEVDDYIRTIFGYKPSRVVYNIDRVDFHGIEIEAAYDFSRNLKLWANYTYQETEKRGDILDNSTALTNELLELPENKLNLGLGYRHTNGLEVRFKLRYVSDRWETLGDLTTPGASTLKKMDAFVDADIQLSCPVWRRGEKRKTTVTLAVENLFDQTIVEEYGYPHPGTTFTLGLRSAF